jgi:hypothetical protein
LKVQTVFAGKTLTVTYHNPKQRSFGDYQIGTLSINGSPRDLQAGTSAIRFSRQEVLTWPEDVQIVVNLV